MLVAAVSQSQKEVHHCYSKVTSACFFTGIVIVALVAWRDCALCCNRYTDAQLSI